MRRRLYVLFGALSAIALALLLAVGVWGVATGELSATIIVPMAALAWAIAAVVDDVRSAIR